MVHKKALYENTTWNITDTVLVIFSLWVSVAGLALVSGDISFYFFYILNQKLIRINKIMILIRTESELIQESYLYSTVQGERGSIHVASIYSTCLSIWLSGSLSKNVHKIVKKINFQFFLVKKYTAQTYFMFFSKLVFHPMQCIMPQTIPLNFVRSSWNFYHRYFQVFSRGKIGCFNFWLPLWIYRALNVKNSVLWKTPLYFFIKKKKPRFLKKLKTTSEI